MPADLQQVINTIDGTGYNGFALMGIAGLGDSYGVDLKKYLSHRGVQAIEATRNSCTFDAIRELGALSTMPAGLIFMDQIFRGVRTSHDCWLVGA